MGNNGRFSDGLILGAILGGAAVFLLGTQKGNKVLKAITSEGFDGLSSIIADFEDGVSEGIKSASKKVGEVAEEKIDDFEAKISDEANAPQTTSSKPPAKRFFRKTK
jgi:gas vesicle protein